MRNHSRSSRSRGPIFGPLILIATTVLAMTALAMIGLAMTGGAVDASGAESVDSAAILVGDRLRLEVAGLEIAPLEVRVPADGTIAVPGVGRFSCKGKSPSMLHDEIEKSLEASGFVGSAGVAVNVVEFAPRRVFLLQGVRSPGAYELPIGAALRLTQVLSLGGGLSPGVRGGEVRIQRQRADGGLPSVIRLELAEITDSSKIENDIRVHPGDTIIIADDDHPDGWVYVGGAVERPGRYPLLAGDRLTALRAILRAGGFGSSADPSAVRLLRQGSDGPRTLRLDLRAAVGKSPEQDAELVSGDVVLVTGGIF